MQLQINEQERAVAYNVLSAAHTELQFQLEEGEIDDADERIERTAELEAMWELLGKLVAVR